MAKTDSEKEDVFYEPEIGIREPFDDSVEFLIISDFGAKAPGVNFIKGREYITSLHENTEVPAIRCGVDGKVHLIYDENTGPKEERKHGKRLWIWFDKGGFWGMVGYFGISKIRSGIQVGDSVKCSEIIAWAGNVNISREKATPEYRGYLYMEVRRLPTNKPVPFETFKKAY